jgi:hypothetical protein
MIAIAMFLLFPLIGSTRPACRREAGNPRRAE